MNLTPEPRLIRNERLYRQSLVIRREVQDRKTRLTQRKIIRTYLRGVQKYGTEAEYTWARRQFGDQLSA